MRTCSELIYLQVPPVGVKRVRSSYSSQRVWLTFQPDAMTSLDQKGPNKSSGLRCTCCIQKSWDLSVLVCRRRTQKKQAHRKKCMQRWRSHFLSTEYKELVHVKDATSERALSQLLIFVLAHRVCLLWNQVTLEIAQHAYTDCNKLQLCRFYKSLFLCSRSIIVFSLIP